MLISGAKKNWPLDGYDSLTESIQAAMVNGELRYLSNLHPALGSNKDYRATYNSQLIPTNQWLYEKQNIYIKFTFFNSFLLHRKNPKITIINNSGNLYDSIKVFTSVNKPTLFYNVKSKSIVEGKILFDESKKTDGCYKIIALSKR